LGISKEEIEQQRDGKWKLSTTNRYVILGICLSAHSYPSFRNHNAYIIADIDLL
jgi:hypothetical protein